MLAHARLAVVVREMTPRSLELQLDQYTTYTINRLMVYVYREAQMWVRLGSRAAAYEGSYSYIA